VSGLDVTATTCGTGSSKEDAREWDTLSQEEVEVTLRRDVVLDRKENTMTRRGSGRWFVGKGMVLQGKRKLGEWRHLVDRFKARHHIVLMAIDTLSSKNTNRNGFW
jgi:hypothetical protein